MARLRCFPGKAIHFSLHREPFVAGLKQCCCVIYVENTYLHSHFLPCFMHTGTLYIFMFALLFMDSICSDFLSLLHLVVKLHTFFFFLLQSLNILLRAFGIHFLVSAGQWIFHETVKKKVRIIYSDQLLNHRLHHLQTWKRHVKKGEKRKIVWKRKKKIKLFLNKNGKFTSFLTSGVNHEFSSRKTHLLFAIAFVLLFKIFSFQEEKTMKISQVMKNFASVVNLNWRQFVALKAYQID